MIKLKLFSLIIIFSFFLLSVKAFTKENNDLKKSNLQSEKTAIQIAAANESLPKVLDIESVGTAVKGKAVDFTWTDGGKNYSFAEYTKGKVVFLNFWATWCGPCRMEIPDIIALSKELSKKDFVVIGISLDNRGTLEQIRNTVQGFAKQMKIPYLNFIPTKDIVSPYGQINSIPTTIIIDKNGKIVERIIGGRSKADFLKSIEKAKN
jgi:thiol-disulfide isomerase/thioredoxin